MRAYTVAVLGAGGRGEMYGQLLGMHGELASVVAVAEPRPQYREAFVKRHALPADRCFERWEDFVGRPKMCDAVVISTMDREHVGPAVACLDKGYHVLLEKPMATTLDDCRAIEAAQRRSGTVVAVCHSMRYNKALSRLKELVDEGRIGRLVTLDQIEQVAYWHQAHSFVRGNWGNSSRSTFMLLAKSCHDIDYIAYLVGRPCLRVSSFGALTHFRRENAPTGSTERCTDGCAVEAACPYSAVAQYVDTPNLSGWPAAVCSPVHTREAHLEAIRTGPYGRCVYRCDNDVVDHQVVLLGFADDVTATFTMTAFTQGGGRKIRLHGTTGEIALDEDALTLKTYADRNVEQIRFGREDGGHGGGDNRVVRNWLEAIRRGDPGMVLATAQESLRTHTIVFAAERSRLAGQMVEVASM